MTQAITSHPDDRLREAVLNGTPAHIEDLVDAVRADHAAAAVLEVLRLALADAIERFRSDTFILPSVLASAEVVHRAVHHLDPDGTLSRAHARGSIVVATLEGDVHDIGKALLVTLFSASGYHVIDLGKQVPVDAIVEAVLAHRPDAVGLSALLVTTSRAMPRCIDELDRRGAAVPVLIGGAAINAAFGRRAGLLPDDRVYAGGVFYCKDVFDGLTSLDLLTDAERRAGHIAASRAASLAERDQLASSRPAISPGPSVPARSDVGQDVRVPQPPFWGVRRLEVDLPSVWQHLDRNTLFRYHWGGYKARGAAFDDLVKQTFEPELARLSAHALEAGWLEPRIVAGYFPCNGLDNQIVIWDPDAPEREMARLHFPRQPGGERLCLSDYVRPLASGQRDVLVLQAVTTGPFAGAYVDTLQRAGAYVRMLFVNGLASATAEALADYAHAHARRDLHIDPTRGLRYSWGYAACPDLSEQHQVLRLLDARRQIGLSLTTSDTFAPEHSTAAMVIHHPRATYFSVFGGG